MAYLLPCLCLISTVFTLSCGYPVDLSSNNSDGLMSSGGGLLASICGLLVLLALAVALVGCLCCYPSKGFQEFRNSSTGTLSVTEFVNPLPHTTGSELTIFPPTGAIVPPPPAHPPTLRPAAFASNEQPFSSHDWLDDPRKNLPRAQLQFLEELGRGWFGRIVTADAHYLHPNQPRTKVIVKMLHEDATSTDQMFFLHEVKPHRDLQHPNILPLLARCLDHQPFLLIFEACPNGDVKSFLQQSGPSAKSLCEGGVPIRMARDIATALEFMHANRFVHTDIAARNALVTRDLTVKLGDYGNSIELHPADYYIAGSVALPVRWCAPETLKCTDHTIETREVTAAANVWSLAVTVWEILELGRLPYDNMTDDQVIANVIADRSGPSPIMLPKPAQSSRHLNELYHLMRLCWQPPLQRPQSSEIRAILDNLVSSDVSVPVSDVNRAPGHVIISQNKVTQKKSEKKTQPPTLESEIKSESKSAFVEGKSAPSVAADSGEFDVRWRSSKPNYIPKTDNALDVVPGRSARVGDSSVVTPIGAFMRDNKEKIPESPRLRLSRKDKNEEEKSPPALDSWLAGVEADTEEEQRLVRDVSDAIRDLDAALAMEKTSSSEENSGDCSWQGSPEKELRGRASVEFKLGDVSVNLSVPPKSFLQDTEEPASLLFAVAEPVSMPSVLFDAEDALWAARIERGEFSEKVKEKSRSIADLMILTHIEPSDDSDSDKERSLGLRQRHSLTSFRGSDSDIRHAVLEESFHENLKRLSTEHKETGHFDSLNLFIQPKIQPSEILTRIQPAEAQLKNQQMDPFLCKQASEKLLNCASSQAVESTRSIISATNPFSNLIAASSEVPPQNFVSDSIQASDMSDRKCEALQDNGALREEFVTDIPFENSMSYSLHDNYFAESVKKGPVNESVFDSLPDTGLSGQLTEETKKSKCDIKLKNTSIFISDSLQDGFEKLCEDTNPVYSVPLSENYFISDDKSDVDEKNLPLTTSEDVPDATSNISSHSKKRSSINDDHLMGSNSTAAISEESFLEINAQQQHDQNHFENPLENINRELSLKEANIVNRELRSDIPAVLHIPDDVEAMHTFNDIIEKDDVSVERPIDVASFSFDVTPVVSNAISRFSDQISDSILTSAESLTVNIAVLQNKESIHLVPSKSETDPLEKQRDALSRLEALTLGTFPSISNLDATELDCGNRVTAQSSKSGPDFIDNIPFFNLKSETVNMIDRLGSFHASDFLPDSEEENYRSNIPISESSNTMATSLDNFENDCQSDSINGLPGVKQLGVNASDKNAAHQINQSNLLCPENVSLKDTDKPHADCSMNMSNFATNSHQDPWLSYYSDKDTNSDNMCGVLDNHDSAIGSSDEGLEGSASDTLLLSSSTLFGIDNEKQEDALMKCVSDWQMEFSTIDSISDKTKDKDTAVIKDGNPLFIKATGGKTELEGISHENQQRKQNEKKIVVINSDEEESTNPLNARIEEDNLNPVSAQEADCVLQTMGAQIVVKGTQAADSPQMLGVMKCVDTTQLLDAPSDIVPEAGNASAEIGASVIEGAQSAVINKSDADAQIAIDNEIAVGNEKKWDTNALKVGRSGGTSVMLGPFEEHTLQYFQAVSTVDTQQAIINQVTDLGEIESNAWSLDEGDLRLRTPDDERSSDSGFRDKGSLSESVEDDPCQPKYNLDDIEAELEDAFVKGAFDTTEPQTAMDSINFEFEESKFYEVAGDDSEPEGELDTEYFPTAGDPGWCVDPADPSHIADSADKSMVPEDIFLKALRTQLANALPSPCRSFEMEVEELSSELPTINIDYSSGASAILTPIREDGGGLTPPGTPPTSPPLRCRPRPPRKPASPLVSCIDTETFAQYLDFLVEHEGKDSEQGAHEESGNMIHQKDTDDDPPSILVTKEMPDLSTIDDFKMEVSQALRDQPESILVVEDLEDLSMTHVPDHIVDTSNLMCAMDAFGSADVSVSEEACTEVTSSPDMMSDVSALTPDRTPFPSPRNVPRNTPVLSIEAHNEAEEIVSALDLLQRSTDSCSAESAFGLVTQHNLKNGVDISATEEAVTVDGSADVVTTEPIDSTKDVNVMEMMTSFRGEDRYSPDPDWDSESDSDSSPEFVWKGPEGVRSDVHAQTAFLELDSSVTEGGSDSDDDSASCSDSASVTDFVPSAWDSQITPTRSALKRPKESGSEKDSRRVWFKKQKYHCVYEYPKEPSDTEEDVTSNPLCGYSQFSDWQHTDADEQSCFYGGDSEFSVSSSSHPFLAGSQFWAGPTTSSELWTPATDLWSIPRPTRENLTLDLPSPATPRPPESTPISPLEAKVALPGMPYLMDDSLENIRLLQEKKSAENRILSPADVNKSMDKIHSPIESFSPENPLLLHEAPNFPANSNQTDPISSFSLKPPNTTIPTSPTPNSPEVSSTLVEESLSNTFIPSTQPLKTTLFSKSNETLLSENAGSLILPNAGESSSVSFKTRDYEEPNPLQTSENAPRLLVESTAVSDRIPCILAEKMPDSPEALLGNLADISESSNNQTLLKISAAVPSPALSLSSTSSPNKSQIQLNLVTHPATPVHPLETKGALSIVHLDATPVHGVKVSGLSDTPVPLLPTISHPLDQEEELNR